MSVPRRRFLKLMAGTACMPLVSLSANAQSYPARPVRLLVGFAAGGSGDVLARLMAQWLSDRLKQTIVVENKVGAGGNIAIDTVLRSPADGLTLLMNTMPALITPPLPENFDLARESTPVAGAYQAYLLMLRLIPRFRLLLFPSSSPTLKPIPARSAWLQRVTALPRIWQASSSR